MDPVRPSEVNPNATAPVSPAGPPSDAGSFRKKLYLISGETWVKIVRNKHATRRGYCRPGRSCNNTFSVEEAGDLTRISHRWSTASPQSSALAVLRSVGLLDVLHEYDCGGLGRKPCQDGPCGASLRQAMRNPG